MGLRTGAGADSFAATTIYGLPRDDRPPCRFAVRASPAGGGVDSGGGGAGAGRAEHAAGRAAQQAYGQAGIVNACTLAIEPLKLVLIDDPTQSTLVPVANRSPDPRRIDIVVSIGSEANRPLLPGGILPPTDKAGAWLCAGQVCLPVVTDPEELDRLLRRQ